MNSLQDNTIDIAGICETWLTENNNPTTAAIKSFGYSIIHNFRKAKKGGGTALIFKSCYSLSVVNFNSTFKSFEYTAAIIKTATVPKVLFVIIYRTGPLTSVFNQELDLLLSDVSSRSDCFVLAGDLNINFDAHQGKGLAKQTLNMFKSYGMRRLTDEPTHISGGSLDQIFSFSMGNQLSSSVFVDTDNCLGSDHFPVYCDFNISLKKKYFKKVEYRNIRDIDDVTFSCELNDIVEDHLHLSLTNSFETTVSQLSLATTSLLNTHAPFVEKKVCVVDTAPWFDSEYRTLRTERRRAETKWRRTRSEDDRAAYKKLCDEASILALEKKKQHFSKTINNSNGNPRTLYAMVNKELDRKQSKKLPDYTDDLDELATTFNDFFVNKIDKIRENMDNFELPDEETQDPDLNLLSEFEPTTLDEITEIIKDSGIKCSPADLLPQKLYKDNICTLLPMIVELVNLSLKTGNVDGVKLADIIPLLKDDSLDPNILKNFRPVSNLTFLGKIIERVVLKRLNDHLSRNNLNCPEQSAYKVNNSTETLLIKISNDILIAADERSATVVMLLDLSAAFDTVDHQLLLRILKTEIGLRGNVLAWFRSFLMGRSQRIRLGKVTSDIIVIKFGVPQGSVLGPVLFNLYIRSIYKCVRKLGFSIFGYADDHQILKSFKPRSQSTVLSLENQCFSATKKWMSKYFLQMNDSKTQIIVFGPSGVLNEVHINGINITSGTTIRFVSTVKNLGIQMDCRLTFEKQIIDLKRKCFRTLRNIRKIRFLLSTDQIKVIVNSLVVSCLDYCNGLYFGVGEKLLNQLQLIQNAAAKAVTGKYKYDHLENDLKDLHWLEIRKRIAFKIALLAYKAVNGHAPQYLQDMFQYCHHGHSLQLMVPAARSKYGARSFSVIGPTVFNNLPPDISSAKNTNIFKGMLKTHLFNMSLTDVDRLLNTVN